MEKSGFYKGRVVGLDNELKDTIKIQVEIDFLNEDKECLWVYPIPMGNVSTPAIGDEILLSLVNNDTNYAVILNCSNKIMIKEEGDLLSITTKSDLTIEINDKNKSLKLKDQNNNKIEMTKDGILLETGQTIKLKAKQNIIIEGVNIDAKAQAQFTAKGNAKAELSASGQTVVKGAMVQIN